MPHENRDIVEFRLSLVHAKPPSLSQINKSCGFEAGPHSQFAVSPFGKRIKWSLMMFSFLVQTATLLLFTLERNIAQDTNGPRKLSSFIQPLSHPHTLGPVPHLRSSTSGPVCPTSPLSRIKPSNKASTPS